MTYSNGKGIISNKWTPIIIIFLTIGLVNENNQIALSILGEQQPKPLFHVHMLAPYSRAEEIGYAQRIEQELESIGIDTDLDIISWIGLGNRFFIEKGLPWIEGGYDICLSGLSMYQYRNDPIHNIKTIYGSPDLLPDSLNVILWSDDNINYLNERATEKEDLIQEIENECTNVTRRKELIKDWQKLWYDVLPNTLIYSKYDINAISTGLYGYDPYKNPLESIENIWLLDDYPRDNSTVVMAYIELGKDFNPLLTTSYPNTYLSSPVMDSLLGRTPSNGIVLPDGTNRDNWMIENFNTTENFMIYPRVAEDLGTFSDDGKNYSIRLRNDVYFHDGHRMDAWDIVFTFQSYLTPKTGAAKYSYFVHTFGFDDKNNGYGNYSVLALDTDSDGFYETVNFHLNNTTASFLPDYLQSPILPEHILGDQDNHGFDANGIFNPNAHWLVKPVDWCEHSFNTGNPSDPGGLRGPIGCGPVVFKGIDSETGTIELQKFNNIIWDNNSNDWTTNTSLKHYLITDGRLDEMPNKFKIDVLDINDAVDKIETGDVNILDPLYYIGSTDQLKDRIQSSQNVNTLLTPCPTYKSLFFNPAFSTSTELSENDRPLNRKGVRHAISHIIPRQEIISHILDGYGTPAYTALPIGQWGTISEDEMLSYKKTVKTVDDSLLETASTTAYDEYNRDLALDWLESEGYDVAAWRSYISDTVSPPSDGKLQFYSEVKQGQSFIFKIDTVQSITNNKSWYWEMADVTFNEGDTIEITINNDFPLDFVVGKNNPIPYDLTVKIGNTTLDAEHSNQFGFFILPLVTTDSFDNFEYGIRSAARYFPTTYNPVNATFDGRKIETRHVWNFIVSNCSLADVYDSREIPAWIVTTDYEFSSTTEIYAFDLLYESNTGICLSLKYPSTFPQYTLTANTSLWSAGTKLPFRADQQTLLTKGLLKLQITLISSSTSTENNVPGMTFELLLILLSSLSLIKRTKKMY